MKNKSNCSVLSAGSSFRNTRKVPRIKVKPGGSARGTTEIILKANPKERRSSTR